MAGLFDKQTEFYAEGRPDYPKQWFSLLADRTSHHSSAWDVATGNGQAAISVAEYYSRVIATDVSEPQLNQAIPHPRVKYLHTPTSLTNDELVHLIGPEGSVDLITVAQAAHWLDHPSFYSVVNRLLKPGGIIAVWCYNDIVVSPKFDPVMNQFHKTTQPYSDPRLRYVFEDYKTLPFPFEEVGLGSEGHPMELDIPRTMSFEGFFGMLKSWSCYNG